MERAVGIAEATRKQIAELLALLVGKAGIMTIGLGVLDVDFLVGYIQVATEDDGFLLVESLQISAEVVFPPHAIVESLQPVLRVGRIAAHKEERLHFERNDAPLMVVLVDAQPVADAERLVLRENRRARIAFLFGRIPVALVALEREVELSRLHLRLL